MSPVRKLGPTGTLAALGSFYRQQHRCAIWKAIEIGEVFVLRFCNSCLWHLPFSSTSSFTFPGALALSHSVRLST